MRLSRGRSGVVPTHYTLTYTKNKCLVSFKLDEKWLGLKHSPSTTLMVSSLEDPTSFLYASTTIHIDFRIKERNELQENT